MGDVKVKLNMRAINQILREAQPTVNRFGEGIAATAGAGFEYVAIPHKWTARGYVRSVGREGAIREARSKALSRAVSIRG